MMVSSLTLMIILAIFLLSTNGKTRVDAATAAANNGKELQRGNRNDNKNKQYHYRGLNNDNNRQRNHHGRRRRRRRHLMKDDEPQPTFSPTKRMGGMEDEDPGPSPMQPPPPPEDEETEPPTPFPQAPSIYGIFPPSPTWAPDVLTSMPSSRPSPTPSTSTPSLIPTAITPQPTTSQPTTSQPTTAQPTTAQPEPTYSIVTTVPPVVKPPTNYDRPSIFGSYDDPTSSPTFKEPKDDNDDDNKDKEEKATKPPVPTEKPTKIKKTPEPTVAPSIAAEEDTTTAEHTVQLLPFNVQFDNIDGNSIDLNMLHESTEQYLFDSFDQEYDFLIRVDLIEGSSRKRMLNDENTLTIQYEGNAVFDNLPVPEEDDLHQTQTTALQDTDSYNAAVSNSINKNNDGSSTGDGNTLTVSAITFPTVSSPGLDGNSSGGGGGGGGNGSSTLSVGLIAGVAAAIVVLLGVALFAFHKYRSAPSSASFKGSDEKAEQSSDKTGNSSSSGQSNQQQNKKSLHSSSSPRVIVDMGNVNDQGEISTNEDGGGGVIEVAAASESIMGDDDDFSLASASFDGRSVTYGEPDSPSILYPSATSSQHRSGPGGIYTSPYNSSTSSKTRSGGTSPQNHQQQRSPAATGASASATAKHFLIDRPDDATTDSDAETTFSYDQVGLMNVPSLIGEKVYVSDDEPTSSSQNNKISPLKDSLPGRSTRNNLLSTSRGYTSNKATDDDAGSDVPSDERNTNAVRQRDKDLTNFLPATSSNNNRDEHRYGEPEAQEGLNDNNSSLSSFLRDRRRAKQSARSKREARVQPPMELEL